MPPEQQPLQFEHHGNQRFSNFYADRNQEIISHLQAAIDGSGEQFIYLWGAPGRGKSHLLQACCLYAADRQKRVFLLAPYTDPQPGIIEGLETMDVVCIDDIDRFIGSSAWETALFNLFNRLRDQQTCLIVAGHFSPTQLPVNLVDLKTRLAWGLTLKLKTLDDQAMIAALQLKADSLGFEISDKAGRFLLTHYTRDCVALWALLHRLDQASLAAHRKVTIPFLKQVLSL